MKNTKTKLQKRQNFLAIITIAVIGLMILPLVGCQDKGEDPSPPSAPTITVRWTGENKSTKELELIKGGGDKAKATLKVTVRNAWVQYDNEKKEIEWTTNDPTNSKVTVTGKPHSPVADNPSIYSGDFEADVEALDYGEVTITVTYLKDPTKKATCTVTVPGVSVSLNETNLSFLLSDGEKETTLKAEVKNTNNPAVEWSSGDEEIATVDVVDNKVVVTPVKVGTTKIIATTEEGGKTAECAIAVYADVPKSDQGIEMVQVPAGTFMMGSHTSERGRGINETQHSVELTKNFYISKYQVTQELYNTVTDSSPSKFDSRYTAASEENDINKRPVEQVTWYDALEFCNKLSEMEELDKVYTISDKIAAVTGAITSATVTYDFEKNGYRLPTEAEWEYACRAGTTTAFNNGDNDYTTATESLKLIAWFASNASSRTRQVGLKKANKWGLYDMLGNVGEWCWDVRSNDYPSNSVIDPIIDSSGNNTQRIQRGGYCGVPPESLRSAFRGQPASPGGYSEFIGFRIVRRP